MALDTTATTTSIELTWTPISAETTWAVRYREQGAEDWTVVFAAADTFLLEGLNHSTIYEAQVATQCDPEDPTATGEYSASVTFATECAAVATIEQDFEGSLLCWSAIRIHTVIRLSCLTIRKMHIAEASSVTSLRK